MLFWQCDLVVQAALDESVSEEGVRKRKRRGSTAGVQYSEDVSDAAFNRLIQGDQPSEESASEVCPAVASAQCLSLGLHNCCSDHDLDGQTRDIK